MNLKKIIYEEIEIFNKDLLDVEGVADKYAEKAFNIPDPNRSMQQQSLTGLEQLPQDDKGELVGNTGGMSKSNVYANPKSLKDFESNVRAVVDNKGNLFVAQLNKSFYHDNLVNTVNNSKNNYNTEDNYSNNLPDEAYGFNSYENEVLLHRVGKTNMFGLSDSYESFASMYPKIVKNLLNKAGKKNPQFKFYPTYYNNFKFFSKLDKNNNVTVNPNEGVTNNENVVVNNENVVVNNEDVVTNPNEGVADKYAEKSFNIPDPNTALHAKALKGLEINGTMVGTIRYTNNPTTIYMNPKELTDFERDVKALSNKEGDLFIAQLDENIYHADIVDAVNTANIYPKYLNNAYDETNNITWHRISNTNNFGFSVSYIGFARNIDNENIVNKLVSAVHDKNPRFNFMLKYWQDLKNPKVEYDDDNSDVDNSDDDNNDY